MNRRKESSATPTPAKLAAAVSNVDSSALATAVRAHGLQLDDKLRKGLETLGELIESNVTAAVMSLIDRNVAMAIEVIESHIEIEAQLMVVDTLCRRAMVVARDESASRHAFAAIAIRSEMAGIADDARDFAREVLFLTKKTSIGNPTDFARIFEWVERLMRDANRIAIDGDQALAKSMLEVEPHVEDECRSLIEQVLKMDAHATNNTDFALYLIMAIQHLRSIAQGAGKIAQTVIYLHEGHSRKQEYDLPYSVEELAAMRRAATIE